MKKNLRKRNNGIYTNTRRTVLAMDGCYHINNYWFGNKHFSKCNEYLDSYGKKKIDWSL